MTAKRFADPSRSTTKRLPVVGVFVGLGAIAALVLSLGVFAGAGVAASSAAPISTGPPTISGSPQEGQTLVGHRGQWSGSPNDYNDFWVRCNKDGGSCANISGAHDRNGYVLSNVDVGNTIRFKVQAVNADGNTFASSVPTAVVTAVAKPPVPVKPATGCPDGTGTAPIAQVSSPARLNVDRYSVSPDPVGGSTQTIQATFHVSDTCNQSVSGALVYVTAVPFNQFTIGPEQPTDGSGNVTIQMSRLGGFPAAGRQHLLVFFVRARKAGDPLLGGISTRRLVSTSVDLSR